MNTYITIPSGVTYPKPVSDFSDVDDSPPLTPQVMQKLEKRREAYQASQNSGGGLFGFLKKALGVVGNIVKGMGSVLIEVIKNPKKLLDPKFWRDAVIPAGLNLIPKVGPLLSKLYQVGLAAYKGVQAVTAATKGKVSEALSLTKEVVAGLFQKTPVAKKTA